MTADRYVRQTIIPGMGEEGQRKLSGATVGVMGVGGLGSPVSMYLAAAGVGRLVLADPQVPEESNLNRQVLHWTEDVGRRSKVESAAAKLTALNPGVEVVTEAVKVSPENIATVFEGCDMIMDCLDSVSARLDLNDHALRTGTTVVHAAVEGWHGQVTVLRPGRTPCLACLYPRVPPNDRLIPIIGVTAGTFGCIQAGEAIKLITGIGQPLESRMLIGDLSSQYWDVVDIGRARECPACSRLGHSGR
ncbi:MAG TPA: HesA/MoeB/ThiF family protein [Methanomassiliicoccaceae archaeon]|jgi:molybdopterin/thiamine biosynthesis adenylyltransferase|nr:HesA/MoeB/ThiF family protein [Euryarchaeota archaeon]HOB37933.1 HesA/MoeB/ThiF family protein [Methanomassiliicoccaceae archaeon]HOL07030.1 HesA/MoeB/ThiF family protein [Methanomassiliicoccaceae archaeon]HPP45085.1 HesA/MoeB/ThiF family protein [Methanomassiliicoccaceae archaeon]HPT74096.1 HesA/MoeB/ThiF family protein [Methanomassiliicoccaceae archaeon]